MRIIIILFSLAGALSAAELILDSVEADDIGHSMARICWTIAGNPTANRQVYFDTKAYSDSNGGALRFATAAYTTATAVQTGELAHCWPVSALPPATTIVACPNSTSGGNTTICTLGSPSRIEFDTLPLPLDHMADPALPDLSGFDTAMPTVWAAGSPLTVTTCADIQTHYNTAKATSENWKIIIPYTLRCPRALNMNANKPGTGTWIVFESDKIAMLPPAGVRVEPEHLPYLPHITTSAKGSPGTAIYGTSGQVNARIRFNGVAFTHHYPGGDLESLQDHLISTSMNYLIFDRCYFYDPRDKGRLQRGAHITGSYVAIMNSQFRNFEVRQNPGEHSASSSTIDGIAGVEGSYPINMSAGQYTLIENNYIDAVGITTFVQPVGVTTPGVKHHITRKNFFTSDMGLMAASTADPNGMRRHGWETKGCEICLVEGNWFENNFSSVNATVAAIGIKPNNTRFSLSSFMRDLTIRHNVIAGSAAGIYLAGMNGGGTMLVYTLLRRVLLDNNLTFDNDPLNYNNYLYTNPILGNARGWWAFISGPIEDLILRNNTSYNHLGNSPGIMQLADHWSEGVLVRDNLWHLTGGSVRSGGIKGLLDQANLNSTPPINTSVSGVDGTVVLNTYFYSPIAGTAAYTFSNNTFVVGCADGINGCPDAATGGALMLADKSADFPPNNYFSSGSTMGARYDAVRWQNRALRRFGLRYDAPYNVAGASRGFGGQVGVDMELLDAARGLTKAISLRASSATEIAVRYYAPDASRPCSAGYRVEGSGTAYTYVWDVPGGSRFRAVNLAGLTTQTTYDIKVGCYTQTTTYGVRTL